MTAWTTWSLADSVIQDGSAKDLAVAFRTSERSIYMQRKLERERPDLMLRYANGELTLHAACVEAGHLRRRNGGA